MSGLDHSELLNNFIIEDVKIFDGHNFIAKGFVVVKNGLITDVGSGKPVETDERDILRISRPQHTLIPGLIDAHIHALEGTQTGLSNHYASELQLCATCTMR